MGKDEVEDKPPKIPKPKVKDEWKKVTLVLNEDEVPKKFINKGDETLDQYAALVKILNELEKLNETLLE